MSTPKEVFEDPERHWAYLTAGSDSSFEDQHFDRKEACRPGQHGHVGRRDLDALREQVAECVSAFANENKAGGLLVLGISKKGEVKGLGHLTDEQRNSLAAVNTTT